MSFAAPLRDVRAPDLDGDGFGDLVVSSTAQDRVMIRYGAGNLTFGATVTLTSPDAPAGLAVDDLDGEGRRDLAWANELARSVTVVRSTDARSFAAPASYAVDGAEHLAAADVTGDGTTDLVVAGGFRNTVSVLRGLGNGTFGAPARRRSRPGRCAAARTGSRWPRRIGSATRTPPPGTRSSGPARDRSGPSSSRAIRSSAAPTRAPPTTSSARAAASATDGQPGRSMTTEVG